MLCTEPTDMRKSFDGLIAATRHVIGEDPRSGYVFMFVNKAGTQTKALYWSRGGYCVWSKRLERGRFSRIHSQGSMRSTLMTDTQLMMWLDGIEAHTFKQKKRYDVSS